jgi:hypothetical protein
MPENPKKPREKRKLSQKQRLKLRPRLNKYNKNPTTQRTAKRRSRIPDREDTRHPREVLIETPGWERGRETADTSSSRERGYGEE